MPLDPILLEILSTKVEAVTAEMSATLQRTSRTLYVKEAADFACERLQRFGVKVGQRHALGAFRLEAACQRLADAARRPGHHHDLAVDLHASFPQTFSYLPRIRRMPPSQRS